MARKGLSQHRIGTRFSRSSVNLRASRDGYLQDWVFCGMGRNGSCAITWTHIFFFVSYFTWKKQEREWEESDSCNFSPIKHKEFRRWWFKLQWWWFEFRRWRLQLQRWRFELWWCFNLVLSFYYTQLWIALLQCDISCLSWLVLFSVPWSGIFLKLNLVTMVLFRRKVSCISRHLYNLVKWFTKYFAIQIIKKRDSWGRHTTLEPNYYKNNNSIRFKLKKAYDDNKRNFLTQKRKHKRSFVALSLIRLVKLNELSSTLLHDSYTWTFMKKALADNLIKRCPANAYIFCGTDLVRYFEDRSPRGTGPLDE